MIMYYIIPFIWHSRKGQPIETVKRWVVGISSIGRGREGWVNKVQGIFRVVETILYDIVIIDTWH